MFAKLLRCTFALEPVVPPPPCDDTIGAFKGVVGGAVAIEGKGLGVMLSGGMLMCVVGVAETTFSVLLAIEPISAGMLIVTISS